MLDELRICNKITGGTFQYLYLLINYLSFLTTVRKISVDLFLDFLPFRSVFFFFFIVAHRAVYVNLGIGAQMAHREVM